MLRVLFLAALLLALGAEPAGARTVQLGAPAPTGTTSPTCGVPCSFVQVSGGAPGYVVPFDGVLTGWSLRAGATVVPGDRVRLRIFRPGAPSGGYIVAADGNDETPTAGEVSSFSTKISVSPGDIIGLRLSAAGDTPSSYAGDPADTIGTALGDPALKGDTGAVVPTPGLRVNVSARLETDADRDGLGDDTQDFDDDNDGLFDGQEPALGTDPLKADTDGDGANDRVDTCRLLPNPEQTDSDLDGPGNACDKDDDNDGIADDAEQFLGISPTDLDTDDDGISDSDEERRDTDPRRADTDRDGLADGVEAGVSRGIPDPPGLALGTDPKRFRGDRDPRTLTNPLRRDTDRDRLADGREDRNHDGRRQRRETDPRRRDTDRDGVPDGADRFPLNRRR